MIPIGMPTKEAKAQIETHSVIAETKVRKCSVYFKIIETFCASYSSIPFGLFL